MSETNETQGRRQAVCVGIDTYPTAPLDGCVADAELWAENLRKLDFDVQVLTNQQATRQGILDALGALVEGGEAGDVLVFQFAGHGTQVPDLDGDEDDAKDEALCPVDVYDGAFVIDDDIWEVLGGIRPGVNLTVFLDCCHSGSATRAFGFPFGGGPPKQRRRRYMVATRHLQEAHRAFRANLGTPPAQRVAEGMAWVNFSACQPHEVAYEEDGQGDFTRHAMKVLQAGADDLTHEVFQLQVVEAFGPSPRQRPYLDCTAEARQQVLLAPIA